MEIKNFSIFKNTRKEKDNQPDYKLSTKIGDEFVNIGAGWIKVTKGTEKNPEGIKYISVAIDKKYMITEDNLTSAGTKVPDFSEVDQLL